MILVTGTLLLCAVIISAAAGVAPSSVIAQEEEEDTSLGEEEEEENLASGLVSNVLDGSGNDDEEENSDAADAEINQDSTDTATVNPDQDQEQDVDEDNIGEFGGDTNTQVAVPVTDQDQDQDQGAANVALNEALDATVESRPTPTTRPPPDDGGLPPECTLEITADKEIYEPGDVVAITITNTGDEPLEFPDAALGLQIKNVDTGEVFPLDAAQVVTTLEPGESRTFEFTYEDLVSEIGAGLISAIVVSDCSDGTVEEVTFRLSAAPPSGESGKIVFSSIRDGNFEIFTMNADGSEQHNISNNPADDASPSWSPDGTKIAFQTDRDRPGFVNEIYIMNADGSEQQRLTNNALDDIHPSWSPDGTKIAFSSTRPSVLSPNQIYIMNADGSEQHSITPPTAENEFNYLPDWSPDGTKIAFSSTRPNGSFEIFTMNADGSDERRLTNHPFLDVNPSWSPDGTKIAFETDRDEPRHPRQIYVMNADGSEQHNISNSPDGGDLEPDWGPATDAT